MKVTFYSAGSTNTVVDTTDPDVAQQILEAVDDPNRAEFMIINTPQGTFLVNWSQVFLVKIEK